MFNFFTKTPTILPRDVSGKIGQTDVAFIDVRSEDEYRGGHATGTRNIPLELIEKNAPDLKKYKEVYVICRSGGRSASAVSHLLSQGIHATNVAGGTIAWQAAGLPVE